MKTNRSKGKSLDATPVSSGLLSINTCNRPIKIQAFAQLLHKKCKLSAMAATKPTIVTGFRFLQVNGSKNLVYLRQ